MSGEKLIQTKMYSDSAICLHLNRGKVWRIGTYAVNGRMTGTGRQVEKDQIIAGLFRHLLRILFRSLKSMGLIR